MLAAESACELLARGDGAAAEQLERVQALARGAMEELRAVVFELRPASLEAEGLGQVLRKHVDVLRRVYGERRSSCASRRRRRSGRRPPGRCSGSPRRRCRTRSATPARERIEVRLEDGGGRLVLSVADDGRGFDAAAPGLRGRRLGLTSMEERAVELGGQPGDRVAAGRGHDRAARGPRVIRVLIADDHAVVRQGLRTYLELQADIEVVAEAADGEAAVGEAARLAPDVVLLDLVMPRLDGVAALRLLRERAPAARVIVLTSFGEDERLFDALRAGAVGFLLKDTEPAELRARDPQRARRPVAALARDRDARGRGAGARRPPARGRAADPARARGAAADRPRAIEQAHRARARRGGEDGQDARRARARRSWG